LSVTPSTTRSSGSPTGSRADLDPYRTTLANGLVVLVKETRKTPAVSINLAVRAGSVCDPGDAPGAMHLLARVIDRGTKARSAEDIAEQLDGRGVSLAINVTRHLFSMACTCLAADFEAVLSLLVEIAIAPAVPQDELTLRKREVMTSIRQDQDNPAVRAVEALMALLYGEQHPYGRKIRGTVEAVESLTRERLLDLHAERFTPGAVTAIIVGDIDARLAVAVVERAFGRWHAPACPPPPPAPFAPASVRRRRVVTMMNKAQADIAYGFVTIKRSNPAYYAHWIMNVTLGQYALGGRLGDSIRERQGMAYDVSSVFDASLLEGPLIIRAGVSPANIDRTIASVDRELASMRDEGITEKELDDTRRYLIGSMPRSLETNAGIAAFLQTIEVFELGLDYDRRLPDLLAAVTVHDVHAAARQVLAPERATVVIAGPYQEP
jgi:zinc protease